MSYVFPYGSNLCNNIQSWMRAETRGQTWLFHGHDHPPRCHFHIHGTQILSFLAPIRSHGSRAVCVVCQLGPPPQTHLCQTYTHYAELQLLQRSCLGALSERETNGCSDRTHSETLPKASVCINLDIPTPAEWQSDFLPDLTHANDKAGVGRETEETVSRGSDQAAPPGRRLCQLSTQAVRLSRPCDTGGGSDCCR